MRNFTLEKIQKQIDQLPEIMSVTQLRYQSRRLQSLLLDKKKPIILTLRSKEIGLIAPLKEKLPQKLLPLPPGRDLGKILFKTKSDLYHQYLKHKMNEKND